MPRGWDRPLIACLWLASAAGCLPPSTGPQTPADARGEPPHAAGRARYSPSLFDQPWVWSDERGATVRLSRWRGAILVVSLVYTSCVTTCPMTIDKLLRMDQAFRHDGRAAEFVLVTLDPSSDTSEQLRRFKDSRRLPGDWHLLRGTDEQTQELADFLQIKIMNDGSHILHDGTIVLLDQDGRLMPAAGAGST